ncbi:MAG: DNA methyltransferase [Candidatus Pacebacteria bacterium]|nr:DNA methyltransferase [Candidatus Paceibacterota bacterium]
MKNNITGEIKKVKGDLAAEIDKRLADKIIEKTNADLLKKLIEQAETINEAIMIAELGTTYKRTGFHFDKRLEKMTDTIKYFKKNEKLSFVQDKNALTHKLITGDNYDALLNLLIQYRGRVDVIYIDPPYGKDNMGEFAKTNYENAITRDNLLSMLYPRLVLARQLLSDNGVIFCSIDDKNQAYVKGLFDEVFEESNFVGTLIHQRAKGGGQAKHIVKGHDYIHTFAKNISNMDLSRQKIIQGKTVEINGEQFIRNDDIVRKVFGKYDGNEDRRCFYEQLLEYKGEDKKKEIDEKLKTGELVLEKNKDGFSVIVKYERVDDAKSKVYSIIKILSEIGKNDLEAIGLTNFDYPKPVELVSTLIGFAAEKDAIILDFFAGSGTTGQAVLELNNQDGGKRQFILATANEITDTTPNGIVNDVTSKRLKRVMTGECYDGTKDFKWNEENKPLGDNLDVYDIATVAPYSDEPFTQIDETLYGKEKLGVKEKIQWVCENFESTTKTLEDK